MIADYNALNYLVIEFNLNDCWTVEPVPDFDATNIMQGEPYLNPDDGSSECYDETWEVDVSYDGGQTWSVSDYETYTVCQWAT